MINHRAIPLSLYVHTPWCVQKCPYCDFNSHTLKGDLPETAYVTELCQELTQKIPLIEDRPIRSLFIGGGTPSLFSAKSYERLFDFLKEHTTLLPDAEITLEANPGTAEQQRFCDYYQVGINRLSIGIQSLQNDKLKQLGRIHDRDQAQKAIDMAFQAGFTNINVDLMFGLPNQTLQDAKDDLTAIIAQKPSHLSWYQLTLEPNTPFHKFPPPLPDEDAVWQIQQEGMEQLAQQGYQRYEVSAFCQKGHESQHNLNYWLFGDYLGLGAGAHSKITHSDQTITRHHNHKHPKPYLTSASKIAEQKTLTPQELPLEFMLNSLRLERPVDLRLFESRTGRSRASIQAVLQQGVLLGFMRCEGSNLSLTTHGKNFLNDAVGLFIPQ